MRPSKGSSGYAATAIVTRCPVWTRASALSGTDATIQTRARSATVIAGDAVSLRYSPGATAISTTSPLIGDRTLASASRCLGVHAEEPQAAGDIVMRRARLLERRGRDGQLRLDDQDLLLRDGPIGKQIAHAAHVGFRLRDGRLALPDVGLRLAPRRLQLRDVRVSRASAAPGLRGRDRRV